MVTLQHKLSSPSLLACLSCPDDLSVNQGWNVEVANFRLQIQALLNASPSLRNFLQNTFSEQKNGRKLFLKASELDATQIPEEPWFTIEQVLDGNWLPWQS
ncbi:DUF29 family protein [Leptolyngbya sp. NK1-12]|uniref:DUF29 family protein n=1 Tax=Leptolyngbya sp. NK1-12 TaxID=2547451 RepID=UPI00292D68F5